MPRMTLKARCVVDHNAVGPNLSTSQRPPQWPSALPTEIGEIGATARLSGHRMWQTLGVHYIRLYKYYKPGLYHQLQPCMSK